MKIWQSPLELFWIIDMSKISHELKIARESQEISLEDIFAATKISIKFLEAIENGDFKILPQVYVRVFIRSYAEQVGLDPEDILKKYDEESGIVQDKNQILKIVRAPLNQGTSQTTVLIIVVAIVVLGLLVAVNFLMDDSPTETEKLHQAEIPNEVHSKEGKQPALGVDAGIEKQFDAITEEDSLKLNIFANESAWISVVIDDSLKKEILLLPNKSLEWKAVNNFKMTIGNAGGVIIKLNDKLITPIGKKGMVVKDFIISRKDLKRVK